MKLHKTINLKEEVYRENALVQYHKKKQYEEQRWETKNQLV